MRWRERTVVLPGHDMSVCVVTTKIQSLLFSCSHDGWPEALSVKERRCLRTESIKEYSQYIQETGTIQDTLFAPFLGTESGWKPPGRLFALKGTCGKTKAASSAQSSKLVCGERPSLSSSGKSGDLWTRWLPAGVCERLKPVRARQRFPLPGREGAELRAVFCVVGLPPGGERIWRVLVRCIGGLPARRCRSDQRG